MRFGVCFLTSSVSNCVESSPVGCMVIVMVMVGLILRLDGVLAACCLPVVLMMPDAWMFRRESRRPVDGFLSRGEPWWVLLAAGKGSEALIGATTMLVEDLGSEVAECKVRVPRRCP